MNFTATVLPGRLQLIRDLRELVARPEHAGARLHGQQHDVADVLKLAA